MRWLPVKGAYVSGNMSFLRRSDGHVLMVSKRGYRPDPGESNNTRFHFTTEEYGEVEVITGNHPRGMRLMRTADQALGRNYHRSGWPYALRCLGELEGEPGLLLDDFVEQTFIYSASPRRITEPWAGIFHHPPHFHPCGNHHEHLQAMMASPAFVASRPRLKLAIALSEHLGAWLRDTLDVPVAVVKHPSAIPDCKWNPGLFESRIVQVGWYMRNTRAIDQLDTEWTRLKLWPGKPHMNAFDGRVRKFYDRRGVREIPGVQVLPYVSHDQYDAILSTSVVLTHLLDASANNVVIECIARNAPLVVNRHPAAVEYLGEDYPLFFDERSEVPSLLESQRIMDAHEYLKALPKGWLDGRVFADGVRQAIRSVL